MRKSYLLFALLIIASLVLSACSNFESRATYFNGSVLVEYSQTRHSNEDDSLIFTFNDPGTYKVSFAITPGHGVDLFHEQHDRLPKDFTVTIGNAPRTVLKTQYVLPDYLTITIDNGDETESHDFQ